MSQLFWTQYAWMLKTPLLLAFSHALCGFSTGARWHAGYELKKDLLIFVLTFNTDRTAILKKALRLSLVRQPMYLYWIFHSAAKWQSLRPNFINQIRFVCTANKSLREKLRKGKYMTKPFSFQNPYKDLHYKCMEISVPKIKSDGFTSVRSFEVVDVRLQRYNSVD